MLNISRYIFAGILAFFSANLVINGFMSNRLGINRKLVSSNSYNYSLSNSQINSSNYLWHDYQNLNQKLVSQKPVGEKLINQKLAKNRTNHKIAIADLANDKYQFCSEPERATDNLVGIGVCFIFVKADNTIQGYYGYPHSDSFICIRAQIQANPTQANPTQANQPQANQISGKAYAITTSEEGVPDIPQSAFKWDREGYLTLEQGHLLPSQPPSTDAIDIQWIRFDKALLDLNKFHRYSQTRMTPVSQLCPWNELH